ncbi:hypothetical protein DRE_02844 [Drechslerella stenobrocha 248]|uniref:Uncharacterized protein n=1 Tax=Drechslerella stenobrocha 248 TaxID=1043628 RepID=W7I687_9PEZI|nr:hypothetical protein DRE_02844 [Drechslerella stenobrocha 248]
MGPLKFLPTVDSSTASCPARQPPPPPPPPTSHAHDLPDSGCKSDLVCCSQQDHQHGRIDGREGMLVGRPLLQRCRLSVATARGISKCSTKARSPNPGFEQTGLIWAIHIRRFSSDGVPNALGRKTSPADSSDTRSHANVPGNAHATPSTAVSKRWVELPTGPLDHLGRHSQSLETPPADDSPGAVHSLVEPPIKNWNHVTDEEVLHLIDKRTRERASQNVATRAVQPAKNVLEDASRVLLRGLLGESMKDRYQYKKGAAPETESDLQLFQQSLDASILRIQRDLKPGFHPLPFYLHHNSTELDKSLLVVMSNREKGVINKVCYNLLVSDAAPTLFTFNIMLRRFTKLRMTNLAHIILTTMFAVGFEPNAHTYAALLQYLTVVQDYDAFGKAVSIMRDSFLDFKNPVLSAAELNGWSKFGDFMSMRRRLRLLQAEGLRDDIYILTIELRYYARRHMWEGGLPALRLLFGKPVDTIDHRALYWAWKLCANCHQIDMMERLKELAQEKRWPAEMLWTRPSRMRGLPYGYKGGERGQGLKAGDDGDPKRAGMWREGVGEKQVAPVRVAHHVPRTWREYSMALHDPVRREHIVMESWAEPKAEKQEGQVADKVGESAGVTGEPVGGLKAGEAVTDGNAKGTTDSDNSVDSESGTSPPPVRRKFTASSEPNLWKAFVYNRKQELLRPGAKPLHTTTSS